MSGYKIIALHEMLKQLDEPLGDGEGRVKAILSNFSCPLNADVEQFLRLKAIEFDKQSVARTYLVFTSYRDNIVLIGYFTIAIKVLQVTKRSLSSRLRQRIRKFAQYNADTCVYTLPAPLIAQIGKNYADNYNSLIKGEELLALALEKVVEVQMLGGGKVVYLECEDNDRLIEFYSTNGFCNFGKRAKDDDEKEIMPGKYLIQMLKYLSE